MTHIYYTYQLRDPRSTKPFYIGKGKEYRAWDHLKGVDYTHKSNTIQKIIREGFEVQVEILYKDLPEPIAFSLEKLFIKRYGRRDNGTGCLTNLTDGGEGSSGRVLDEESKQRHRASVKAAMQRPETKARISATSNGRFVSEATKELNRQRSAGEDNPMFGKTGDKSPIKGRKNIHHPVTLELKLIPSNEVESYQNLGWKLGRLPGTANLSLTGNKFIYHPISLEVKSLPPNEIEEYLLLGWMSGRYPKGQSKIANRVGIYNPLINIVTFIHRDQLEKYINDGWVLGRAPKTQ